LKGEIRSQFTLERCKDQQLALGDHSALIHPGAETEILSLGNNQTEFEASSPFGRKQARDAPSHVAEGRASQEDSFSQGANQGFYRSFDCYILNIFERQRVVATLFQLRDDVP
jgi:hypothetical protein